MKEMADIKNHFHTLLNRIDKKLTQESLKYKKAQMKVNDQIINLKDSNYIVIGVI